MKVLVAGGTGFIGQALLTELIQNQGHHVMSLSRSATRQVSMESRVCYAACDWRDAYQNAEVLDFQPNVVVNVLGSSHPRSSLGGETAEIEDAMLPFFRLIDALRRRGLIRVVFASSAGAIYNSGLDVTIKHTPDSAYCSAKLGIEHFLTTWTNAHRISTIVLRVSNPLGWNRKAGFGVVNHFSRAILNGIDVNFIGDYSKFKDYVDVRDVGRAFFAALVSGAEPGHCSILDVGSGWAASAEGIYRGILALHQNREFPAELIRPSALRLQQTADAIGWQPRVTLTEAISRVYELEKTAIAQHRFVSDGVDVPLDGIAVPKWWC